MKPSETPLQNKHSIKELIEILTILNVDFHSEIIK